ncbi:MAG: hypothetical protein VW937_08095, partial [Actinomycetota bacterium]
LPRHLPERPTSVETHCWVSSALTPKGTKRLFHFLAFAILRRSVETEQFGTSWIAGTTRSETV